MNPAPPSSPEELRRMLDYGMGRAILYLLKQDLSQYRDLILDVCLHHIWYDQQCTGGDTLIGYLYPLIKASGDKDYYRDEILRALRNETEYESAYQLLEFAKFFAQNGYEAAREAIYEKVCLNDIEEGINGERQLTGADVLVELDGLRGLTYLLDACASELHLLGHYGLEDLVCEAEKAAGVEEVRLALKSAAEKNPKVAEALALVEDYSIDWTAEEIVRSRKERAGRWKAEDTSASLMTWEEVKSRPDFKTVALRWARTAPDEEMEKAAREFDPKAEPNKLWHLLSMFRRRPFLLDLDTLLGLLDHPDETVSGHALMNLELVHSDRMRDLFHRLVARPDWPRRSVSLLKSNYQPGDHEIITKLLEQETDADECHALGGSTIEVYKANPVAEGLEPLLMVYEKTPCPLCRDGCVKLIESMGLVPDWMAEEYRYDAGTIWSTMIDKLRDDAG